MNTPTADIHDSAPASAEPATSPSTLPAVASRQFPQSSEPAASAETESTSLPGLLAGLTYQTPVIGTIRIGGIAETDGKRIPFTDDKFSIHTRFRDGEGNWVTHQAQKTLEGDSSNVANGKLASIPVRIIYDNPNLNMGEQYAAFTTDGRPACVGNGLKAKRAANGKVESVTCPGPAACTFGIQREHRCETFARALFHIEGQHESEGAFIFRTGSYNSVNDMRVRLQSLHAGFGGKLSGLPMKLVLRAKSSAQSCKQPFYYASLEPRFAGFKEALQEIRSRDHAEKEMGFNRKAFETAMALLLSNGSFTENVEDSGEYEDLIAGRPDLSAAPVSATSAGPAANVSVIEGLQGLASQYASATNSSMGVAARDGVKAA